MFKRKFFMNREINSLTDNINTDNQLKNIIIQQHINPAYLKDVSDTIKWRYRYRKLGIFFDNMSKLFSASSTIFAFSAGFYVDMKILSFISGILGTLSLVGIQLSNYTLNESKECTSELNKILSTFSINNMPDISSDSNQTFNKTKNINEFNEHIIDNDTPPNTQITDDIVIISKN